MEAIHSAPEQTLLLSTLLRDVSFTDVQALARLNVIRYDRDQQSAELVVTFCSKLTIQVFDEIQQPVCGHDLCRRATSPASFQFIWRSANDGS